MKLYISVVNWRQVVDSRQWDRANGLMRWIHGWNSKWAPRNEMIKRKCRWLMGLKNDPSGFLTNESDQKPITSPECDKLTNRPTNRIKLIPALSNRSVEATISERGRRFPLLIGCRSFDAIWLAVSNIHFNTEFQFFVIVSFFFSFFFFFFFSFITSNQIKNSAAIEIVTFEFPNAGFRSSMSKTRHKREQKGERRTRQTDRQKERTKTKGQRKRNAGNHLAFLATFALHGLFMTSSVSNRAMMQIQSTNQHISIH